MSEYVYSTVIVTDQSAAKADFPNYFNTGASADGITATHWFTSGPFDSSELEAICNSATWQKKVYFGQDWQSALSAEGLQIITPVQPE